MYSTCSNRLCGRPLPQEALQPPSWATHCSLGCARFDGNQGARLVAIRAKLAKITAVAVAASAPPPRQLPMTAQSVPVPPSASRPTPKKTPATAKRPSR